MSVASSPCCVRTDNQELQLFSKSIESKMNSEDYHEDRNCGEINSTTSSLLWNSIVPAYGQLLEESRTSRLRILVDHLQDFATVIHLDLERAIRNKMILNGRKYPVAQAKGKTLKYTEYSQSTGISKADGQSTLHLPSPFADRGKEAPSCSTETLTDLTLDLRQFVAARDWDRFHTPRNLLLALGGEIGELVEQVEAMSCSDEDDTVARLLHRESSSSSQHDKLAQEVADVTIYILRLADVLGVDWQLANKDEDDSFESRLAMDAAASHIGTLRSSVLDLWKVVASRDADNSAISTSWRNLWTNAQEIMKVTPDGTDQQATLNRPSILIALAELSDKLQFLGDTGILSVRQETSLFEHLRFMSSLFFE